MFGRKVGKENYITYLEKEIQELQRRMKQLELERDNAIAEKEKSAEILNKYKSEYESLIADSKKLLEKQKKADKTMDKIISDYRDGVGK